MNKKNIDIIQKKILVRPFSYSSQSIGNMSLVLLILLMLQILLLVLTKSYSAIIVISASFAGSIFADLLNKYLFNSNNFSFLTSAVQGIIAGMLVPETFPPVTIFFIAFFTILLTKYIVGTFANSFVNSALIIVAVSWIIGMSLFPEYIATRDILQNKNPSYILIQNGYFDILRFDSTVTQALNNTIFNLANISIPEGYISLLLDTRSIIPAFRFNLLTLLSSIVLYALSMYKLFIPTIFIVTYSVLVRFVSPFIYGGNFAQGDMLLSLFTGGTLFCALFVLQWFGTTPLTKFGQFIYGFIGGIFAFLIAGCGTSPSGMCFAILCTNIFSTLIQVVEDNNNLKSLKKMISTNNYKQGV